MTTSLRLNNTLRQAFVRSVMNDVPDNEAALDKLRDNARDYYLSHCVPKAILQAFNNKDHRGFIQTTRLSIVIYKEGGTRLGDIYSHWGYEHNKYQVPFDVSESMNLQYKTHKDNPKFLKLCAELEVYNTAVKNRMKLEKDLTSAAAACSTLKQLQDTLPHLTMYMPSAPEESVQKGFALAINTEGIMQTFKDLGAPVNKGVVKKAA